MTSPADEARIPLKRALISVYDKTGLDELVRGLHDAGVALVSTGGSAARIDSLGIPVTRVEELTGFPECLDGRVKTLHPRVHAGILADRRLETHVQQLTDLEIEPFDLVVSNLYPFTQTVASGATPDECVEQIDIGGPSMVRAAAKNHPSVAIVTSPARYGDVLRAVVEGGFTLDERKRLAAEAFTHTASYDVAVASWMGSVLADTSDGTGFPAWTGATWQRAAVLRYGENPHQPAALYRHWRGGLAAAEQLHGKEMSYNNYVDTDAARRAANDFDLPAVAIIKHANPCGIAVGDDVARGASEGARVRPGLGLRRRHRRQPTSVEAAGRAGGGGLHRGDRGAGVRRRRGRGPAGQEEHPDPGLPDRRAPGPRGVPRRLGRRPPAAGGPRRRRRRRPEDVDAGHRGTRRRRDAGRPRVRLAGLPLGEVQRDPARLRRRLGRDRHGPGQPRRLVQARHRPGGRASQPDRSPRRTPSSRSRTGRRSSSTPA